MATSQDASRSSTRSRASASKTPDAKKSAARTAAGKPPAGRVAAGKASPTKAAASKSSAKKASSGRSSAARAATGQTTAGRSAGGRGTTAAAGGASTSRPSQDRTASRGASASTSRKSAKPASRGRRTAGAPDALALLKQDHDRVKKLVKQFKRLKKQDGSDADKAEVAERICAELTVHTRIEEELFYPALRERLDDEDILDEAQVEHDSAKSLIEQIRSAKAGEGHFDALVTVLGEYVDHHVEEEESEMFRKARRAKLDTAELGERMAQRKAALQAGSDSADGSPSGDGAAAGAGQADPSPSAPGKGGAPDTRQVSLDETHADRARS